MDFEFIMAALPQLLSGLDDTLFLALTSLAIGFVLALGLALLLTSENAFLRNLANGYVYIFRSTPLLVQIFLIYYGSGQFRDVFQSVGLWVFFRDAWFCAILALTLNTAAYTGMIIKGGLQSVPLGQIEAARAIGMTGVQAFRRIVFPIAIRQALPAYGNEIVLMVKSTSLASTVTILEITGIAKKIISATYQPVEVFLIAGCLYLSINFIATRLIALAEAWLDTEGSHRTRAALRAVPR